MRPDVRGRSFGLLAVVAAAGVALPACGRARRAAEHAATDAAVRGADTSHRTNGVWLAAATRAQAAIAKLESNPRDRDAYLELRRDALESMYVWRRSISMAADGAFGPEISFDEGAGPLGALDGALDAGDASALAKPLGQLRDSFSVSRLEIENRGVPDAQAAQALSDAAFALGQAIAESTSFVPQGHDAALADAQGLFDAIDSGAKALGWELGAALEELGSVRQAPDFEAISGRLALIRATGALGARIREIAAELGVTLRAPYPALSGAAAVSALTLPRPGLRAPAAQAAVGAKLFEDTRLSAGGRRSCATCHVPGHAFTDGRATPASLDARQPLTRNTPTLLFAPLEARLMWDGRLRRADGQAMGVIHATAEMGQSDAALAALLAGDAGHSFRQAFEHAPGAADVGAALAAYEASAFVPDDAPIDRYARGEIGALSTEEMLGFDVFAGAGRCARCHVPPVFAGSRPPDFTAPVFGVLGVPKSVRASAIDPDVGRFAITHREQDRGAFRTPTVRDVASTSPFFHNGSFATLEQVVDFYDRGGGQALGYDVPNQDPDVRPLRLSDAQKSALLAFLTRTLTN